MRKITAEWNKEHLACYTDERLASLYDRPMELREVLMRKDGPWDDVPAADRMWVFWRAATQDQQATTLESIVTRSVANLCLACGIAAVEQWAALWLSGEDRSGSAAKAAAKLLDNVCAARRAVWAAECAAEWAARAEERAEWAARAAPSSEASAACAAELAECSEAERDLQLLNALQSIESPIGRQEQWL